MSNQAAGAANDTAAAGAALMVHASAVAVGETGILIRGRSGAGKSSLALCLLALAGQERRFARLVGDDRIELVGRNSRVVARGHPAVQGMIETRGQGIMRLDYEPAVVVGLVVDLLPAAELVRYPEPEERYVEICGAKLPRLALLSDRSSYDCAHLVMAHLQHAEIN
ncbi:MAG: HPr kinase/phosphorylase [Methylovirgula sp.]